MENRRCARCLGGWYLNTLDRGYVCINCGHCPRYEYLRETAAILLQSESGSTKQEQRKQRVLDALNSAEAAILKKNKKKQTTFSSCYDKWGRKQKGGLVAGL